MPEYNHLVIDEAHHLEEAATRGLRQEVDGPGMLALLDRLGHGLLEDLERQPHLGASTDSFAEGVLLAKSAAERVGALFQVADIWVAARLGESDRREESVRITPAVREDERWGDLSNAAEDAVTALAALDATLRKSIAGVRDWLGGDEPDQGIRELEMIRGRLEAAQSLIHDALLHPDANRVYWFSQVSRMENLLLRAAPVNVGSLLRNRVYEERRSIVFTSATLAVGGTFDYFISRVGLGQDVEELILPSPFDFYRQALVCLPTDLPMPEEVGFDRAVEETIAAVAGRVGGRTLALFTSHQQLRDVHAALKQRVDLDEVLILGQGIDGQRRQLLKTFEEAERPLLLGTATFWEGIDIPGERLSCVIIVRLPFPVPTDPVFAARAEQVRDPFTQLALPQAALRLKQGFGRLIRSSTDRGAVVILDNRILGRDYGKTFLQVLPPAARYVGPGAQVAGRVGEWLEGS